MAGHRNFIKTDVAIVGAGPAGTAAAISCACAGLAVVILERERFPRERPGETLHPGIEALLEELGVAERLSQADLPRHEGIWVCWDGSPHLMPYGSDETGPWRGFQAWRAEFDTILLERARELGVEIQQPCRALEPILSGGGVSGLQTSSGTIEAMFVIDAAGSRHWLARRLGLAILHHSPRLIARFGYLEGTRPARDMEPMITADEQGWTWTAKVRPGLYHWTRLNLDSAAPEADFVPDEFRGLSPRGSSRGADVSWRVIRNPAGIGYFAVGDAAAVLDPASSHGVLRGILSGMLAAHLIAIAHKGECDDDAIIRSYGRWLARGFIHDVAALQEFYNRLPKPPRWVQGVAGPGPEPGTP